METDWRQECAKLHIELDSVRAEMGEWETKFERLMLWKEQPRLPVRGFTTLSDKGGEFAYDYPDLTPKCPEWKELEDFLAQWQAKFPPSFHTVVNVKKHVVTQEEIDKWR